MPFHPVRIFAPSDDDCFFHVVAFFQGADIDDWRAAKGVREAIARGLAQVFLSEPWNDLDKLTTARLYGVAPLDAPDPALKPQHDLDAAGIRILAAYKSAKAAHPQEFPQDIIDYIVWVQFSSEELQSFRWLYREARLALPEHAIWGDEDMGVACVEVILHTQIKLYALADDVDCRGIEDVISIAWDQAHGADRLPTSAWSTCSMSREGTGMPSSSTTSKKSKFRRRSRRSPGCETATPTGERCRSSSTYRAPWSGSKGPAWRRLTSLAPRRA
jgi:hypothetical protein